jgi:hypothetical protein
MVIYVERERERGAEGAHLICIYRERDEKMLSTSDASSKRAKAFSLSLVTPLP